MKKDKPLCDKAPRPNEFQKGDIVNSKTLGPGRVVGEFSMDRLLSVVFPPDPPHTAIRAYTVDGRLVEYDWYPNSCGRNVIRIRDVDRSRDLTI